jgi:hypothetical protein
MEYRLLEANKNIEQQSFAEENKAQRREKEIKKIHQ